MTDETTTVAETEEPIPAPEAPAAEQEEDTASKAQAALSRELAEERKARKRLEDQQKKADEARKAEAGQYKELAEQREKELETERGERARVEHEQRVTRIATRLKFVDPADVVYRVPLTDSADEGTVESALSTIADSSPHLIAKDPPAVPEIGQVLEPSATPPGSGPHGPQPPAGKAPLRTQADVEALSDGEFTARYREVEAVLKAEPQ